MKRLFWKSAFVVSVLALTMALVVPAMAGFEALFPAKRGPDGLYRNGDSGGLVAIVMAACLWVANRLVAVGFRMARVSGNRWSLLLPSRSWELHPGPGPKPLPREDWS